MRQTDKIVDDVDLIFKLAVEQDNLSVALKAKELMYKIVFSNKEKCKFNIKEVNEEELEDIIEDLKSQVMVD